MIRAAELNVADEISHAVLRLLLDGYGDVVRFIMQLARLIMLKARGCIRRGLRLRRFLPGFGLGSQGFLFGLLLHFQLLLIRVETGRRGQSAVRLRRRTGQALHRLFILNGRPLGKTLLHRRHIAHRRAGVA